MEPHFSTRLSTFLLHPTVNQICMCTVQCRCVNIGFPAFRLLFQYTQKKHSLCPIHSDSPPLVETVTGFQACIKSGNGIFGIRIKWDPLLSSIGITLRAEARTKQLPLLPFFKKLYRTHLCREIIEVRGFHTFVSRETVSLGKQDYLLSVVEKMLQQVFTSGKASPLQVDAHGRTLLHVSCSHGFNSRL